MRKRILVDMDGVLADVYSRFHELHIEETGENKRSDQITGILEHEAYPGVYRWVTTPGFFRTVPVMKDSREVLEKLNKVYDIVVVSMATEFPESLTDKQLWLIDNFPFLTWRQSVFCGNKSLIKADLMIDDHFKNLDNFEGETIMFLQPHNMLRTDHSHKAVSSWKEIGMLLL